MSIISSGPKLNNIPQFANHFQKIKTPERSLRATWETRIADAFDLKNTHTRLLALKQILKDSQVMTSQASRSLSSEEKLYHQNIQIFLNDTISKTPRVYQNSVPIPKPVIMTQNTPIIPPVPALPHTNQLSPLVINGKPIGESYPTTGDGDCFFHSLEGKPTDKGIYGTQFFCENVKDIRKNVSDNVLDALSPQPKAPDPVLKVLYKQWWIERLDEGKELQKHSTSTSVPNSTRRLFENPASQRILTEVASQSDEKANKPMSTFIESNEAKAIFSQHIQRSGTDINNRTEMAIFAAILGPIDLYTRNGKETYAPYSGTIDGSFVNPDPTLDTIFESRSFSNQEKRELADFLNSRTPDLRPVKSIYNGASGDQEGHYEYFIPYQ